LTDLVISLLIEWMEPIAIQVFSYKNEHPLFQGLCCFGI
jgi:hypothetical protein